MTDSPSPSEPRSRMRLAILLLLVPTLAIVGGELVPRMLNRAPLGDECGLGRTCGFGAFCHPMQNAMLPTGFCTHACERDDDCPAELHCSIEPPRLCAKRPSLNYGELCEDDRQCHSNVCTRYATRALPDADGFRPAELSRAFCTQSCSEASDCPEGDACEPVGTRHICKPERQIAEAYRKFIELRRRYPAFD